LSGKDEEGLIKPEQGYLSWKLVISRKKKYFFLELDFIDEGVK
jgi:hypothetical protein